MFTFVYLVQVTLVTLLLQNWLYSLLLTPKLAYSFEKGGVQLIVHRSANMHSLVSRGDCSQCYTISVSCSQPLLWDVSFSFMLKIYVHLVGSMQLGFRLRVSSCSAVQIGYEVLLATAASCVVPSFLKYFVGVIFNNSPIYCKCNMFLKTKPSSFWFTALLTNLSARLLSAFREFKRANS